MEARPTKTFYSVIKTNPPSDRDYVTPFERKGPPPDSLTQEEQESWHAFSAYDTVEGARNQVLQIRGIGKFIYRYEIPLGIGIT